MSGVGFLLVALLLVPGTASADFGFAPGSPTVRVLDAAGNPYAQAGGHPDRLEVGITFNAHENIVESNARDVEFDFPPGFLGDPDATPTCPRAVFEGMGEGKCPPQTQVGLGTFKILLGGEVREGSEPIYNIEPAPGEMAELGFSLFIGKTPLTMHMRHDDFGVTIDQRDLTQTLPLIGTRIELWGVPADHQKETDIPRRPFVTLPARCDRGPLAVIVRARSWQHPEQVATASGDTGVPITGCDALRFAPGISFDLDNPAADSPTGATVDLTVPQGGGVDDLGAPAMQKASIALPEGVSISPGVASGLSTCTDEDLHRGSEAPATCPPSSRVGAVELSAQQLRRPLAGDLYLGAGLPGERFRLFAVVDDMGVSAKLVVALQVEKGSGRVTATLDRLPEVPFDRIRLSFDGGPRALLATPLTCGVLTASGTFESYGSHDVPVRASDTVAIARGAEGGPCPESPPFSPGFIGGATGALAGRPTGLTLTLLRRSGEQLPDRFAVTLPRGLSANLGGVETCAASLAMTGGCPSATRVGSALGEIGSGAAPIGIGGDAYLTSPYRRAPFGLALVFDATIGPFDLGTAVVRAALRLDPRSGRLSVETDALPREIEGIPIRFQTIGLDVDRPGFIRNPTSCEPTSIEARVYSVLGAAETVAQPFAIRGCDSLRFAPRIGLRLLGKREIRRGGRPGLRIAIRSPDGGTNLHSVDVELPAALSQRSAGLRAICSRRDALAGQCSEESQVGRASGRTPMLNEPLSGTVHVVQPQGSGPPELWTTLGARGVRFDVRSEVVKRRGRMHTQLVGLPDFPLSRFVLKLAGGRRGTLSLTAEPCRPDGLGQPANVAFEGQNHAYLITRRQVEAPCPSRGEERTGDRSRRGRRG